MATPFFPGNQAEYPVAPVEALRRFTRKREPESPTTTKSEHCELCSEVIPTNHRHLLEVSRRRLLCACQACSLLFGDDGAGGGKYRLVPRRYLELLNFQMTDRQWDELRIPVHMAFLFYNTEAKQVVAFYPSPAGATESLLDLEGWAELTQSNSLLNDLAPDVEALLINRVKHAREHYIVPIDACYQLVGLIRTLWKGLSGGTEAQEAIAVFFQDVHTRSQAVASQVLGESGDLRVSSLPVAKGDQDA
jgi:hypothetical protein